MLKFCTQVPDVLPSKAKARKDSQMSRYDAPLSGQGLVERFYFCENLAPASS